LDVLFGIILDSEGEHSIFKRFHCDVIGCFKLRLYDDGLSEVAGVFVAFLTWSWAFLVADIHDNVLAIDSYLHLLSGFGFVHEVHCLSLADSLSLRACTHNFDVFVLFHAE
jgi:hypothetical protein